MSARRDDLLRTAQFELQRELANNIEADPQTVMRHAEMLARSYDLAKKPKVAQGYFDMASQASRQALRAVEHTEEKRLDQRADLYLNAAILQWRAGRIDSNNFFRAALTLYRLGVENDETGIQLRCHQGSVYSSLFLKDLDSAVTSAMLANHLEEEFGLPVQVLWSQLLLDVIQKCQENNQKAYTEAVELIDNFIKEARNDLYYRNGLMLTDLRTLINQYSDELAE
ncbi:MAG: hypothetical protein DWQ07_01695 [Chloroflexi bacterium]|nr:MAG: hypothetical protein DWQ07_01695 [Chloroflexota bacterium]MBL1193789.1 hypothetical protein [Chloroflexota bacterium]NOH11082.1 hypothetical protein [Chloroflexota bacterium]